MTEKELVKHIYIQAKQLGFEIYLVGGYVRDKLLNKPSKDLDFVVIGDAMKFAAALQPKLGLKKIVKFHRFGTFRASLHGYDLEFVNARKELYQENSRKPLTQITDLNTDLSRRDFTINAMAMDISDQNFGAVIDRYNGRQDIKDKLIRTPLEANKTFSDDPLRMMRAIRFAGRLNFSIEPRTWEAIQANAERLKIVSQERITDEFNKILMAKKPSIGLRLLEESGLLNIFFPEFQETKGVDQKKKYHHKDVFYHTLEVVDNIAVHTNHLPLRLAALFHDIAKPRTKRYSEATGWSFHGHEVVGERMTAAILKKMKYPVDTIHYVKKLVNLHLRPMALVSDVVTDSAVRRLIFLSGNKIDDLMTLCRADITSKNPNRVKKYMKNYDWVIQKIAEVEERDRLRNFQPPVDGNEIMELFNITPGPHVGKIKTFVEEAILNGEVPNDHDACLKLIMDNKRHLSIR
jgi:putative nucleotidyltransferase with HDIG domain